MSHHWLYYLVKELSRHTTGLNSRQYVFSSSSFFITKETDRVGEEAQLIVRVKQNERTTFSFVFLVDWSEETALVKKSESACCCCCCDQTETAEATSKR